MTNQQVHAGNRLRVLAWPASLARPNGKESDPYPRLLYTGLDGRDIEIGDFQWARARDWRRLLLGHWNILHMHWPDQVVGGDRAPPVLLIRIVLFWFLMKLARMKGIRLLWTVHNAKPHDTRHSGLQRRFFEMLLSNLTALVCLSSSAGALLAEHYPPARRLPVHIVPHGHYRGCYPDRISRADARRRLGIGADAPVLLFLGQVRVYKNIPRLIDCFRAVAADNWRLVIAGEPRGSKGPAIARAIAARAAGCEQILLFSRFIANEELQFFLRASDLVVLPYSDILNSGTALLALSFDRPVLAPAKGALVDLREEVGREWLMTYEEPDLTPETLQDAVRWARRRRDPATAPLDTLDWERIRDLMAETFRTVA